MIGKTISHYKIIEKLGEGGMGVVYKAEDTKLHRNVALKFLPVNLTWDDEAKQRFINEARAASALDHANICTLYEINETDDNQMYIAMAHYDGETLKDKFNAGSIPVSEAVDIAVQVAKGLARAHEEGIIHRDIKPANIIITDRGEVKIIDFGLAKLSKQMDLTKSGTTLGTVTYMSPEQALGSSVDHRTDIWSLGVVLYEMLSSQQPFTGDYDHKVIYSILNEPHQPLSKIVENIPKEFVIISDNALAKKTEDRYATMDEMLADLLIVSKATQESEPGEKSTGLKKRKRSLLKPLSTTIIVAALFSFVLGLWLFQPKTKLNNIDNQISIAVLPLKTITHGTDQSWFAESMTDALTTDLARIGGLRIISQSSAMQYKDNPKPIPEIASELQVDYVVDGSVLRVGNEVRISAKLINGPKDEHLWAQSFQREFSDILVLQSEIAYKIANHVRIKLAPGEMQLFKNVQEVNPDAYEAYLRGRFHYSKHSSEGYLKSIEYFDRAVRIDSGLAMAYAGLGDVYSKVSIGGFIPSLSQEEALLRADLAVNKAIELDSTLAEAYSARAHLRKRKWDWVGSEHDFQRAIEVNPSYAWAYHNYAALLEEQRRYDEAITNRKLALKLDPLNVAMNAYMAAPYIYSGDYDKAISILDEVRNLHPNEAIVYHILALPYVGKGMYAKAIELWQEFFRLYGSKPGPVYCQMGAAYALAGKKKEALQILHELIDESKQHDGLFASVAWIYINLGETDKAFEWWEKAYQKREAGLKGNLNKGATLDSLRSDPRFVSLLKRMGLKEIL